GGRVGMLGGGEGGREKGLENKNWCGFRRPVTDSGYSQRPLLPIRFGYISPPHRFWLIGSAFQFLRQFVQPSLHPVCLDVLEGLIIYSGCSTIGFAALISECQDVFSVHLVIQSIETKVGRFLRFCV